MSDFAIHDASPERAAELAARLRNRLPGAAVFDFASQAEADTHARLNGGLVLDRWTVTKLLDTLAAGQDIRIDSIEQVVNEIARDVKGIRDDLDEILPHWRGDGVDVGTVPMRIKTLEKHDQADYARLTAGIKWAIGALVAGLAWMLGKFGDRLFDMSPPGGK